MANESFLLNMTEENNTNQIKEDRTDSLEVDGSDPKIVPLKYKWILWYHDPNDLNWGIDSYKKMTEISSINDFWNTYSFIKNTIIENSMFFIMKDGIFPRWEDTQNCDGGCWSFKITKGNIKKYWTEISIYLLADKLLNKHKSSINGLSISPKKSFCIIKIWNNNKKINSKALLNKQMCVPFDNCIYKTHRD